MRASGARLLARAQAEGMAREDIDGADLFALVAALAWLNDQPALAAEGSCELERFIVAGDKIVVFVHARVRLKDHTEWTDGPGAFR